MNSFTDLDHALLAGIVFATLRSKGLKVDALLNEVEDSTPYLKLTMDDVEAVIVVLPGT